MSICETRTEFYNPYSEIMGIMESLATDVLAAKPEISATGLADYCEYVITRMNQCAERLSKQYWEAQAEVIHGQAKPRR